jgi:hypothetical protein
MMMASLFSCPASVIQTRCRSMLKEVEVKAFKEVLGVPKIPANQYSLFLKEKFPIVKQQNPSIQAIGITKIISGQWRNLPESEKAIYRNKAEQSLKQYAVVKGEFENKATPGHKTLMTLLRYNRKDLSEASSPERAKEIRRELRSFRKHFPEGPYTGKGLFLKERLAGKKIEEKAGKEAFAVWKSFSPAERGKYEEKAKSELETYKKGIRSFLTSPASS